MCHHVTVLYAQKSSFQTGPFSRGKGKLRPRMRIPRGPSVLFPLLWVGGQTGCLYSSCQGELQEEWEPKVCCPRCFADCLLHLRFAPTFVRKDCRMLGGLLWGGRQGNTTPLSGPWGFQEGQENPRIVYLLRLLVCREPRTLKGPPTLLSPASPFYPRGNWVPERESDLLVHGRTGSGKVRMTTGTAYWQPGAHFLHCSWSQDPLPSYGVKIWIANFRAHAMCQALR